MLPSLPLQSLSKMIKTLRYLILSLVVSCLACGKANEALPPKVAVPAHVIMHGDKDFTEAERAGLLEAAKIWRAQSGGLAQITIVFDLDFNDDVILELLKDESKIIRGDSTMDAVKEEDCAIAQSVGLPCDFPVGPKVLAWVVPGGGIHNYYDVQPSMMVVIDRMPDHKFLVQVITHELGHILGVPHINDTKAIMYPSASPKEGPVCLTEKDLAGYCMANGCANTEMYPCDGEE